MDTTVTISGPLFDGRAAAAVHECLDQARSHLTGQGAHMLRSFPMDKTGRATGAFQETLKVITGPELDILRGATITGVVWTPWLEGTSKRNQSTRFKGYHLFRLTCAWLNSIAPAVLEENLAEYLPQMGGTP